MIVWYIYCVLGCTKKGGIPNGCRITNVNNLVGLAICNEIEQIVNLSDVFLSFFEKGECE